MFDPELAIKEWRQAMISNGIKSPALLDELESHLREDIERLQGGLDLPEAFETAVLRMGSAKMLKPEFTRARGFFGASDSARSAWINRILGTVWFVAAAFSLYAVSLFFTSRYIPAASPYEASFLFVVALLLLYAAGMIGSILLFCGARSGRLITRTFALLMTIVSGVQILNSAAPASLREWCGLWAAFSLLTVWLLHRPDGASLKSNAAKA